MNTTHLQRLYLKMLIIMRNYQITLCRYMSPYNLIKLKKKISYIGIHMQNCAHKVKRCWHTHQEYVHNKVGLRYGRPPRSFSIYIKSVVSTK